MKKLLTLLMVLVLLFGFAGCSDDDVRGDITSNPTSGDTSGDTSDTEKEFSMGATSGNTYKNEFIGLGCTLSSDWSFYTDDQIKELNNIALDAVGDDLAEQIQSANIIYDMYATNTVDMSTVNVNLEKFNALTVAVSDLSDYISNQIPNLKEALENMGCSNVTTELTDVKIGDKKFTGVKLNAEINGVMLYELIFCTKSGEYVSNISIATFNTDTTQDIIDCFYIVD